MSKRGEITFTCIRCYKKILEQTTMLLGWKGYPVMYITRKLKFWEKVNVMIDTGTVGISKYGDRNINQY